MDNFFLHNELIKQKNNFQKDKLLEVVDFSWEKRKISNQKIGKSSRIIYLSRGKHQEKSSKHYHGGYYFTCLVSKPSNFSRMISYFLPLGTRSWSLNCLMSSGWTYIFIDNTKSCTRMVNALVFHPRVGSRHEVWGNFSKKPLSPLICCGSFIPCWKIKQSPTKKISKLCSIAQFFQFFPAREFGTFPCHLVTPPRNRCNDHEEWQNGRKSEDTLHLQIRSQSTSGWWKVVGWSRLWQRGLDDG